MVRASVGECALDTFSVGCRPKPKAEPVAEEAEPDQIAASQGDVAVEGLLLGHVPHA